MMKDGPRNGVNATRSVPSDGVVTISHRMGEHLRLLTVKRIFPVKSKGYNRDVCRICRSQQFLPSY